VKEVGIDDFAWKRGKRYGTIILDLKTHKILDLLPDREAESVRQWLLAHPEGDIVSRDRGGSYADGAASGAPQAIQVADRWHLCKNLGDAIEAYLVRKRLKMPPPFPPPEQPQMEAVTDALIEIKKTEREQRMQAGREHKVEQHEHIRQLSLQGMSVHGIARHLGIARNTVRAHLRMGDELVVADRPKKRSILDPSYDYIVERWQQGCTNGQQILREIRAKGYRGSATTARIITTRLRKQLPGMAHPPKHTSEGKCSYSPRELQWLLAKRSTDLTSEEQSEEVQMVHQLLQDFLSMLRERRADRLKAWMKAAQQSGIKELRSFVAGIERDYDAVSAGLSLPWSQGVVEGTINKLKTHKRLMYGRASFRLLRQKLLHPT
jgi:transposase